MDTTGRGMWDEGVEGSEAPRVPTVIFVTCDCRGSEGGETEINGLLLLLVITGFLLLIRSGEGGKGRFGTAGNWGTDSDCAWLLCCSNCCLISARFASRICAFVMWLCRGPYLWLGRLSKEHDCLLDNLAPSL